MIQYQTLLRYILKYGVEKPSGRDNMPNTLSVFGYQMMFDLQDGFPLVTTKYVSFKNIVVELLWFLRGDDNIKYLVDNNCNIWNEDAYRFYIKLCENQDIHDRLSFDDFASSIKNPDYQTFHNLPSDYRLGDTGEQYPVLWRHYEGHIDQTANLIDGLKNNPHSRRHIITAWNPNTLDDMALPACHSFVQFYVRDGYLDCQLYQRSGDLILGCPYNIASYSLLTHILAEICDLEPGRFIHTLGDVHIYTNHIEAAKEQSHRTPKDLPELAIEYNFKEFEMNHIENIHWSQFKLYGYRPWPKLENPTPLNTGL